MKKVMLLIAALMAFGAVQSSAHQPQNEKLGANTVNAAPSEARPQQPPEAVARSKSASTTMEFDPLTALAFGGFFLGMISVFMIAAGNRKTDYFAVPLFISGLAMLSIAFVVLGSKPN